MKAPLLPMLFAQIRSALLVYWRMPYFTILSIGLPIIFFVIFGLPALHQKVGSLSLGAHLLASLAGYAMSNVLVYNVGIGQANRRARKLDLLERATPLPGWMAITASMLAGLVLATVSLLGLLLVGGISGVSLDGSQWLLLGLAVVFGSLPMLGVGMILGYGPSPNLAPALASLIYLPMAFASGLFVPLSAMPNFVQNVAPYLPLYHLGELSWNVVGGAQESPLSAIFWTVAWTVALFAIAIRVYRFEQERKFA